MSLLARHRRPRGPRRVLEAQWEHVKLLERLPQPGGRGGVAARQALDALRARRELSVLRRWERVSESSYRTYTNEANHVRLRRLLDFVHDGDRVLDVGIGFGYVTGILMRERRLEHYCGVDLKEHFLTAVDSMAAANELDLQPCHLEVKNALEITPEWMAPHRPDVVLVLEVLEHVEAPDEALARIAAAVGEDTTVLFTVPLLGRLEGVWGHVSLFDRGRVEEICARAGLTVHYAEPLFATWILVAASPGKAAPARLAGMLAEGPPVPALLSRAARDLPDPVYPSYTATDVYIGGSHHYARERDDPEHTKLKARLTGVFCDVSADPAGPATGGARLRMTEPAFTRLQLSFTQPGQIETVRVMAMTADGEARVTWTWEARRRAIDEGPQTHVLRPGRNTPRFRVAGAEDTAGVVALEVEITVRAGSEAGFRLHRAAYVGPPSHGALTDASG